MGSGVILPSPKHRRQQQACSSAANPDRTSQPGSNALLAADGTRPEANPQQAALPHLATAWGKRPPHSQPTRIGRFAHSPVCWFLRCPVRNQLASDALPAITAGGTLVPNQPESRPSRAGAAARRCEASTAAHSPCGPSATTRSRQLTSGGFQPRSLPAVHSTNPISASHPQRDKREGNSTRRP